MGFLFLLAIGLGLACAHPVETVYTEKGVEVHLRRGTDSDHYQHPVEIPAATLVRALAAVQVQFPASKQHDSTMGKLYDQSQSRFRSDGEPMPLLHPSLVARVAEGVSQALAQAEPQQAVIVMAVRRESRLGVLSTEHLTSFIAAQHEGRLYLDVSRIEWEIPRDYREKRLPTPRPDTEIQPFRVVPAPGTVDAVGPQVAAIDWRSEAFAARPAAAD